jgi:hypothetical protein
MDVVFFLFMSYKLVNLCMIFCEILTLQALLHFERYKTWVAKIGNI